MIVIKCISDAVNDMFPMVFDSMRCVLCVLNIRVEINFRCTHLAPCQYYRYISGACAIPPIKLIRWLCHPYLILLINETRFLCHVHLRKMRRIVEIQPKKRKKKQQQKNERLWWTSLFRVCYCIKFRLAKEEKYLAEQQMQIVYITKLLAYTIQKKTNEE